LEYLARLFAIRLGKLVDNATAERWWIYCIRRLAVFERQRKINDDITIELSYDALLVKGPFFCRSKASYLFMPEVSFFHTESFVLFV